MRITVLALFSAALLLAAPAAAQPKKLTERVKELSQKVDEALKQSADGAATLKSLQDLQTKVTALSQTAAGYEKMSQGFKAMRAKAQDYENRLGNMELALAAIKMQMATQVASAGFKDGFFIQSPNKKFLLRIGGLFQGGYLGMIYSDDGEDKPEFENVSSFVFRRARLATSGHLLNWRLAYRVEFDFASVDPGPLLEGWGELVMHRLLKVRLGKQKIPMGRQMLIHSAYQQFVERSGVTGAFAHGWDLGVMVRGDLSLLGVLSYQMGIFNGAGGERDQDDNTDFLYGVRLVYQPLGPIPYSEGDAEISKLKIAVGGAFSYNLARTDILARSCTNTKCDLTPNSTMTDADDDGHDDNVGVYTANAELTFRMGGIAWQNELFYRREDPGAVDQARDFWGIYSQASFYHFDSTLELAARYGFWQPNDYGQRRDIPRPNEIHEVAVVLNALTWGRNVKWQAEYAHQWQRDLAYGETPIGKHLRVHVVRLQMQFAF